MSAIPGFLPLLRAVLTVSASGGWTSGGGVDRGGCDVNINGEVSEAVAESDTTTLALQHPLRCCGWFSMPRLLAEWVIKVLKLDDKCMLRRRKKKEERRRQRRGSPGGDDSFKKNSPGKTSEEAKEKTD